MKNEKKEKAAPKNEKIEKLIESAIPVRFAVFKNAVLNGDEMPETSFDEKSNKEGRRVQMWKSFTEIICLHKGEYFFVPFENVVFSKAK